ncbi:mannose-P-dolichol utilization defect 1 protein [Marasmius fiardii PR-910]|nr:mannose-P-dolichol utilization defect 1 protein [Marasmius fiardii PR-910]
MTAITKNLPWFIRDLGVSIVGQKCYTSLVENLDIGDVECIKYSISKGLGIGIVVGGSIMKVPQLLLIVNARSARGVSLTSYIFETLSYGITLAYSYRNQFPFSTYGENLFLTVQNVVITFLIIHYAPTSRLRSSHSNKPAQLGVTFLATLGVAFLLSTIDKKLLQLLQLSTLPLSLFSKLPQIRQNFRAKSTGQLSAFAVISQVAGCAARLFTIAQEVGDSLLAAGFLLALGLNLVLGVQMYIYWGRETVKSSLDENERGVELEERKVGYSSMASAYETPSTPTTTTTYETQGQAIHHRVATPPPMGNRKWARKVD